MYNEQLRAITKNAVWVEAPHADTPTRDLFGGMDQLIAAVDAYRKPSLARGKLLPTDDPLCVEDNLSAVLMMNSPSGRNSIFIADYRAMDERVDALIAGHMTLMQDMGPRDMYEMNTLYMSLVNGKECRAINNPGMRPIIARDLMHAGMTAIEQLAYLYSFKPN
jgi:hypothetical protein